MPVEPINLKWIIPYHADAILEKFPQALAKILRLQSLASNADGYSVIYDQIFRSRRALDQDIPVASLEWLGYSNQRETRWCVRADPVMMTPNRDFLMLLGQDGLSLHRSEVDTVIADLNQYFINDGLSFKAISNYVWIIVSDTPFRITCTPLVDAVGQNVKLTLPKGQDAKFWHSRLNEIQMFLHHHVVNQERERQRLSSVNSVWLWGSGHVSEHQSEAKRVYANSYFTKGICKQVGITCIELNVWSGEITKNVDNIIVISDSELPGDKSLMRDEAMKQIIETAHIMLVKLRERQLTNLEIVFCDCVGSASSRYLGWRRFLPWEI